MKQNSENNHLSAIDKQSKAFLSGGEFHWKTSEEELWAAIEAKIEAKKPARVVSLNLGLVRWAVAAGFVLLVSLGSFLRFYTTSIETPAGEHLVVTLPDGSTVKLNAESSLNYHPYWWKFKRELAFEGEGFFEVQKGKKFSVVSAKATTQVLGTSFNILARDEAYTVTCITGTVKVKSNAGHETELKPNSKAEVKPNGEISLMANIETLPEISWRNNLFLFTASPVKKVFTEIERQYGIKITSQIDDRSLYTGNFTRNQDVEEVLQYICPALGYKYIRKSANEYLVFQEE